LPSFLVVQHSAAEFLGPLEQALEDRGIGFVYSRPFMGDRLPPAAGRFDALWLLGGPGAVVESGRLPWLADEQRLVAAFRRARRPVVGMGLGGLVVAMACGGTPRQDTTERAGWTQAAKTPEGAEDPVAAAIAGEHVLVMHAGGVDLPPQVPALAVGEDGGWLVARPDPLTYALVFRPEVKPATIEDAVMEEGRECPDDIGVVLEEARRRWDDTQRVVARVTVALVAALGLMTERRKGPVIAIRPA